LLARPTAHSLSGWKQLDPLQDVLAIIAPSVHASRDRRSDHWLGGIGHEHVTRIRTQPVVIASRAMVTSMRLRISETSSFASVVITAKVALRSQGIEAAESGTRQASGRVRKKRRDQAGTT